LNRNLTETGIEKNKVSKPNPHKSALPSRESHTDSLSSFQNPHLGNGVRLQVVQAIEVAVCQYNLSVVTYNQQQEVAANNKVRQEYQQDIVILHAVERILWVFHLLRTSSKSF
jgi:hypothetical protein